MSAISNSETEVILEHQQIVRLECLKAAAHAYNIPNSYNADSIIRAAQKFEEYIQGSGPSPITDQSEVSVVYDKRGNTVSASDDFPVDLTGYTIRMANRPDHVHLPQQHRDGKPPWCDRCGLTKELLVPKSRSNPQHEFIPAANDLLICADCTLPRKDHRGYQM